MSSPPIKFQRTYVTLAAADLRKTYIRDTIVVDDTGAGVADVALQLPKIGTAYAPVGLRTTIVKASNATHAVAITPNALDAVTSGAPGAFPDFNAAGVANNSALPASTPGSITLEATDMALAGSAQPNPTGGTPTTAGAWLAIDSGAGGTGGAVVPPTSPRLYVSSTGSDAITQPGTLALPLATPQEAFRRLGQGYLIDAIVILVDIINGGVDPNWSIPAPIGNAKAICVQTTYTVDIAGIVATGGTAGSGATATPGTFTSANASAANSQQGKILLVSGGPPGGILNTRYPVDSNDGAGGFTVSSILNTAPVAGNVFDILSRSGGYTWSGQLTIDAPGNVIFDGLEMKPTGANANMLLLDGIVLDYASRWTSVAAGFAMVSDKGEYQSSIKNFTATAYTAASVPWLPVPAGVTPCGVVIDGTAAVIGVGGSSAGVPIAQSLWHLEMCSFRGVDVLGGNGVNIGNMSFQSGFFTDCGFVGNGGSAGSPSSLFLFRCRITNGRVVSFAGAFSTAICAWVNGSNGGLNQVNFVTPTAVDAVQVAGGAYVTAQTVSGIAGAAKLAFKIETGGTLRVPAANTITGGTPGSDVAVDGGVAFAVALVTTMNVVGSQNGTFQHSTDSTAAPGAATINKFSGKSALAVGTGAAGITITNSLVAIGDQIQITPIDIDATIAKYKAVAGAGNFVVTTDVNATAIWKYQWQVLKATV